MAQHIGPYDENNLAVYHDDDKEWLVDRNLIPISEKYTHILPWGEGYYYAELGSKKNIIRPNGTLVLKEWHHDISKVTNGFIIFGNTIRKSKTNPQTRYVRGVAHVSGIIIFPMIFNAARWLDNYKGIYVEIDTKPYIITLDGSIYDPTRAHLPTKMTVDMEKLLTAYINWTLPGLQFFYCDTDAPINASEIYHIGDIFRAGRFTDVTPKLLRPIHKTRFLVASAHTAMLYEMKGLVRMNPKVATWQLCTLHFNSYFKVVDVYEKEKVTQVTLLHIPQTAAYFMGGGVTDMNFINKSAGHDTTLIKLARKSLDEKLQMDVHPLSFDEVWLERTALPIGLDIDYTPMPLGPLDEDEIDDKQIVYLSKMIHRLAHDKDIDVKLIEEDNFPYLGVEGSVCEGCIYAKGIYQNGEGCGRLFTKSFRDRYIKGCCEFYKSDLYTPSLYEMLYKHRKEEARLKADRESISYAVKIVKDYVDNNLDGDVDRLKLVNILYPSFDQEPQKNGGQKWQEDLLRAIMTICFCDTFPDLNIQNLIHGSYRTCLINNPTRLWGTNSLLLGRWGVPKGLRDRIKQTEQLIPTIGNQVLWYSSLGLNEYLQSLKARDLMDKLLANMYDVMTGASKPEMDMKSCLYHGRKQMAKYEGAEGFARFVQEIWLEAFLDERGEPRDVFPLARAHYKDNFDNKLYFAAIEQYCDFVEALIKDRAERMIAKIKEAINC